MQGVMIRWGCRVLLVVTIGVAALAADFVRRMSSSSAAILPATAVLFTGDFDRIHAALPLVREARIQRLFISGANRNAGVLPDSFASQFQLDAVLVKAIETGHIEFGPWADNTLQNSWETACWYEERNYSGPVLLITSDSHMPRASLALERALPGSKVQRMSVARERDAANLLTEFFKYAATRVLVVTWARTFACPPADTKATLALTDEKAGNS